MQFQALTLAVLALVLSALAFVQAAPINETLSVLEPRGSSSITWYDGSMLNNPACGGGTPSSSSMIAAVRQGGRFGCGDRLKIKYNGKSVSVRVVDYCGGCASGDVDLTKGAFKKLASLSKGRLSGSVSKM